MESLLKLVKLLPIMCYATVHDGMIPHNLIPFAGLTACPAFPLSGHTAASYPCASITNMAAHLLVVEGLF